MSTRRVVIVAAAVVAAFGGGAFARPDILVADFKAGFQFNDDRILRYDAATGQLLGEFVAPGGPLDGPTDMAFGPEGDLYVTSIYITAGGPKSPNIIQYDGQTGAFVRVLVQVGSGGLCGPAGLAFDGDGRLYVSSGCDGVVLRYDAGTGAPLGVFVGHSTFPPGGVNAPVDLFFGPDNRLYVTEYHDSTVRRFDLSGAPAGGFFEEGFGSYAHAHGMALGADGRFYVALYGWDQLAVFDFASAEFLQFVGVGPGQGGPHSLAFGPDGLLYGSNHLDGEVFVMDPQTNTIVRTLSGGGLDRPTGIAFVPEVVCYPDCNGDGVPTVADFGCFQTSFVAADPYADCNQDSVFTVADFGCFQASFVAGCP